MSDHSDPPSDPAEPKRARSGRLGMREIARRVGVAPMTVSRALNDPDRVSPETRRRILAAIEEAGIFRRLIDFFVLLFANLFSSE